MHHNMDACYMYVCRLLLVVSVVLGVDVVCVRGERPPRQAVLPLLLAGNRLALVVFSRRNLLYETRRNR
jgi:hypothetical protein